MLFASTIIASNAQALSCSATADDWGSGYVLNVTVTNDSSSSINAWQVSLNHNENPNVTGSWNANIDTSGSQVNASNVSWNGSLSPGQSTSFGYQGTHSGNFQVPTCIGDGGVNPSPTVAPTPSPAQTPTSTPNPTTPPSPTPTPIPTSTGNDLVIQENESGFCEVEGTIDSNNQGFTGSGFANTENAAGRTITWDVYAANPGTYSLVYRYANGSGNNRNASVLINGSAVDSIDFATTGSWSSWTDDSATVSLNQGNNRIILRAETSEGLANIDSLTIAGSGLSAGDCGNPVPTPTTGPSPTPTITPTPIPTPTATGGPAMCDAMGWATRNGRTGGHVSVTGGGNATPVIVSNFGDLQNHAKGTTPAVIYIDGTVGSGWSGRSGDRLTIGSNKTIVGLRAGTELKAPIHVNNSSNVIVRNLVIKGPGSNSDQAWDNITIEGSSKNVWIDHCEFWDGQDGNADVVKGADNVTFTWNIFGYRTTGGHNFSNLVASSDNEPVSQGKLNITLMFNHFTGVAQRQPRCRYGNIHVVNNLFTKDGMTSQSGISAGKECRVLIENNHFKEVAHPVHKRSGGVSELRGNNIFENTTGNKTGYGGSAFEPPYTYSNLLVNASQLEGMLIGKVGATLSSPQDCR